MLHNSTRVSLCKLNLVPLFSYLDLHKVPQVPLSRLEVHSAHSIAYRHRVDMPTVVSTAILGLPSAPPSFILRPVPYSLACPTPSFSSLQQLICQSLFTF